MNGRAAVLLAYAAPLPFVAWPAFRIARGELRWDYVAFLVVPPLLAYASAATRRLFFGLYPIGLVGLLYDAMRFVKDVGVTPERVHVCDLRAAESLVFGTADGRTAHDWLQAHARFPLDVLFAIPYGTFIFASLAFAIFLWRRDEGALRRFAWCYLLLNVAGFATYHVYPAAPPWYFHTHGCAVDLAASSSEGPNLARVDAWLGVPYFRGMYGRASDVFGAVPSLHVAYPLLIVLFGFPRFGAILRAASIAFSASMCVAAVYLDHHWILDVVLGLAYGAAAFVVVERAARVRARARARARVGTPAAPAPKIAEAT